MKKLLLVLSLAFLMAACSDSGTGTKPPQKGHQIGNWMVYKQKAVWIGSRTNDIKTTTTTSDITLDTLTVNAPNLRGLTMYRYTHMAIISYVDSIYSDLPAMGTVDTMRSKISPIDMYIASEHASIAYGNDKKRVVLDFNIHKAKDTGEEPNKFFITVGNASHLRTFVFNVTGLDSAYTSIKPRYPE